jgi:hypothetical protein
VEVTSQAVRKLADLCIRSPEINPDPVVATVANQNLIYGMPDKYSLIENESQNERP